MTTPSTSLPRRKVLLHVGTRKSGTTYLQRTLIRSRGVLAERGVALAVTTQDDHAAVTPLLRRGVAGDAAALEQGVGHLVRRATAGDAAVRLVTMESLAELPGDVAGRIVDDIRAQGFDVEVVVTARHWGLTLPSEWQQDVKQRSTVRYADYVAAVRDRTPAARIFLARQDLPDVVRRWTGRLGPEQVHVIACPPSSRTEGSLVQLFCSVLDVDPEAMRTPTRSSNTSLSLPQAEMLRRVNVALGDRLTRGEGGYEEGVRTWLTGRALTRQASAPILLPAGFAAWCAEESQRQLAELDELGVGVIGRRGDLEASPDLPTGTDEPSQAEVAAVAVAAVADLCDLRRQERTKRPKRATGPTRDGAEPRRRWWERLIRR
ncbi:hypothetical protein SAMN04487968_11195 [Nocardioides terrae]|uniref:Uncharacterized protein n=1 Tax=Nocardioides terrae TaxID=574651 RepID=A0A1I1M1R1_9ACTN|nr:hypothetical protein [Nocardioides terrae]SFC78692.1 hypothetical protein SAMN04487968_11195 [Nocardioides terrae]